MTDAMRDCARAAASCGLVDGRITEHFDCFRDSRLLAGQWGPLYFIYFIQIIGTTAMMLFDYCPLARFLSLMPWNRREPFSLDLLKRTVFSPPVRGNILQGLPAE
ncbi:MAG: hypothetical protein LC646_04035 [Xanthomonadaceae bacterium]|nr:hypothetical protein [Xanthomonadaceae bacterium]